MLSSSASFLWVTISLAALLWPLSSALELYGCYIPSHRPDEQEVLEFISCIHNANGVRSADGGRWGRSLRHINEHTAFYDILKDDILDDMENMESSEHVTTTENFIKQDSDFVDGNSILLESIGYRRYESLGYKAKGQ